MSELLLALAMICTKTNDLNLNVIKARKECVAQLLECRNKTGLAKNWERWISCLREDEKK